MIASKRPKKASDFGTLTLSNVYESLAPMPKERPIKELRVFQILPHGPDYASNTPRLGLARAANARLLLGTVPVEADGSAHFTVPARKPLYFQAVDAEGRAVRTMMSEVYLQPGENRGCIGCHEPIQTTGKNIPVKNIALNRPASEMTPGPDGTAPMSFMRLVQPILDRRCAACHDGSEKASKPDLRPTPEEFFTTSYNQLAPYLRWYQWGGDTIARITSLPGEGGADMSPLSTILEDAHHGEKLELSDAERRTLYLWLDANVPFYGTGDLDGEARQLRGEAIDVPEAQ